MVIKWPTIPIIYVPFLGFAHNQHPTFHGIQKEYATQKVARVKGSRKSKGKRQEKQFGTGYRQKNG